MKRFIQTIFIVFSVFSIAVAGNPDRQGESGAAELLLNPWARSAGVHSMSTSFTKGVEAMRVNIAGMSNISSGSEITISHARLYEGTSLGLLSAGYVKKNGDGAFGFSITSVDFGDILITTTDQPEGIGGSYSPNFFNLGVGYSYTFSNKEEGGGKISVGALGRFITETLPDVSASGIAFDAGVQYASGEQDNFKLGISLRNVGTPMKFGGDGLGFLTPNEDSETEYNLTVSQRGAQFELPTVFDIGISYDIYVNEISFIRGLGNFTSNAFSKDQLGVGAEFHFNNMIALRGAYKIDLGEDDLGNNLYTGLAGGVSIDVPLKRAENRVVGIDYAYRTTNPFRGTHNFSLRFGF